MKTQLEYNIMDAIFKAKVYIEALYPESVDPRWFYTKPYHSFSDEENTVKFYVLEGSPPRGFIIANYALGIVVAFDNHMRMCMYISGLSFQIDRK